MVVPKSKAVNYNGPGGGFGWVVLALGSNLGERDRFLREARAGLTAGGFPWTLASPVAETAPVGGPPGQGPFLNQVLAAPIEQVGLEPEALLDLALELERRAGRVRRDRWGPRTLDVDLLFFGPAVILSPRLEIPHPRLSERRFVLEPLAAILPDLTDPRTGFSVREMLEALNRLPEQGRGS